MHSRKRIKDSLHFRETTFAEEKRPRALYFDVVFDGDESTLRCSTRFTILKEKYYNNVFWIRSFIIVTPRGPICETQLVQGLIRFVIFVVCRVPVFPWVFWDVFSGIFEWNGRGCELAFWFFENLTPQQNRFNQRNGICEKFPSQI